ncbi:membrane protein insertase YidC [Demequina sp. NBRC 110054]|uniref:membrane protein insertase YidC n=1 Tax=Demequina sp. NBRC 110054 TaxID=1570343 RepID=UPI0009FD8895|nr:membrane protein insertase YidC [Demequina sp. NBRC 110054]
MDFLNTILWPLEWLVANIMVIWHQILEFIGMDPAAGITWALSIVGLVVTIRVALIPLFVKQINASRAMQVIAPELRAVQDKYKGKKDQASREAMSRETMELYAKHKTNPFASCLPILIQMPVFFALFRVLNGRLEASDGLDHTIGLLSQELIDQASSATLFGAQLSETFLQGASLEAKILSAVLIVTMVATTFLTQRQLTQKNMPASALEGPMAQQQKILLYVLPFIFVLSGPNFPVGVLIYWTTTNLWTMGQQFYVIRRNPTPGSEAHRIMLERQAEKAKRKGITVDGDGVDVTDAGDTTIERPSGQRQQPKRKNRKKR